MKCWTCKVLKSQEKNVKLNLALHRKPVQPLKHKRNILTMNSPQQQPGGRLLISRRCWVLCYMESEATSSQEQQIRYCNRKKYTEIVIN